MPAIINCKICDQSPACGGFSVCPKKCFKYNEELKRIEIDNSKCISCGACAKVCPIGAIGIAKNQEEYEELKRLIEEDPRCPEDLFVDRYGGDIVSEDVLIEFEDLDKVISKNDIFMIEVFNDDSIMCLLKSIPFSQLISETDYKNYYRCNIGEKDLSRLGVNELPSLLLCKNGKVIKVINGYFENKDKAKLVELIK